MSKHQPGRRHTVDPSHRERSARRSLGVYEVLLVRIASTRAETASRRRMGRTHPTHACLSVHKGFESLLSACADRSRHRTPAISATYENAVSVLPSGGGR